MEEGDSPHCSSPICSVCNVDAHIHVFNELSTCTGIRTSVIFSLLTFFTAADDKGEDSSKPYAPKILYAPDNWVTRSIIKRANWTFATVELLLNWTQQVDNCSTYFLERYPRNSTDIAALRNLTRSLLELDGDASERNGVGILPNDTREQLEEVNDLLDPEGSDNLWQLLESARDASERVERLITQFDWDVFKPVASEAEMEERARHTPPVLTRGSDTVLAGVVFHNDINSTEVLRNVSVSIRLNSTFVHDTGTLKKT